MTIKTQSLTIISHGLSHTRMALSKLLLQLKRVEEFQVNRAKKKKKDGAY